MNILDLRMYENDSGATTVRGYLIKLLLKVWAEEESFSGKRPFGNSGWQHDIFLVLARNNLIAFEIDDYEEMQWCDTTKGIVLIKKAIKELK